MTARMVVWPIAFYVASLFGSVTWAHPSQQQLAVDMHLPAHLGGAVTVVAAYGTRVYAGVGPRVVRLNATRDSDPETVAASDPMVGSITAVAA